MDQTAVPSSWDSWLVGVRTPLTSWHEAGYGGYPASPTRIIRPSGSLSETLAARGLEEHVKFP